jgi:hypothetical protein
MVLTVSAIMVGGVEKQLKQTSKERAARKASRPVQDLLIKSLILKNS